MTWHWQRCAIRVLGELSCFSLLIWNFCSPVPLPYFPGLWSKVAWLLWRTISAVKKAIGFLIFWHLLTVEMPWLKVMKTALCGLGPVCRLPWASDLAEKILVLCVWSCGQPGFTAPLPWTCTGLKLAFPFHILKFKCIFFTYNRRLIEFLIFFPFKNRYSKGHFWISS